MLDRITAVDCLLGCLSKVSKAGIRKRIACWMLDVDVRMTGLVYGGRLEKLCVFDDDELALV